MTDSCLGKREIKYSVFKLSSNYIPLEQKRQSTFRLVRELHFKEMATVRFFKI